MVALRSRMVEVPDLPFSEIQRPGLRRAVEAIELGLGGREEWDRYVDLPVGPGEKDPVTKNIPITILGIARSVYGKKLNVPRSRK